MSSIEIKSHPVQSCTVTVPGSKSYTHRMLMASALSNGKCLVDNCLKSDDTYFTISALEQLGVQVEDRGQQLSIKGKNGCFNASAKPIWAKFMVNDSPCL